MKTGIFYFSTEYAPDRQRLIVEGNIVGYVRVELVEGNVSSALDQADPRTDEAVMNTHEVNQPVEVGV